MRGRNALREGLRNLAHAFGSVFLTAEHIPLRHVKTDLGMALFFHEAFDELVSFLAEGLANRIQEDEH